MEVRYERSQQQVDAIVETEKARLLRLQIWYLEEENARLCLQLSEQSERTGELQRFGSHARKEAQTSEEIRRRLERALHAKSREIENVKVSCMF